MKSRNNQSAPLSRLDELARRRFAELSESEKAEMGRLSKAAGRREAATLVANLNRRAMAERSKFDADITQAGMSLMASHMEAGLRSFIEASRAVAKDLDVSPVQLRGFLRSWYSAARDWMEDNGHDISGTDDVATVRVELSWIDNWEMPDTFEVLKRGSSDDDRAFYDFAFASQRAIRRVAEFEAIKAAKHIRGELQSCAASGIFDDPDHRNLWDEYVAHVFEAPSQLDMAWEETLAPHILIQSEQFSEPVKVLMTISREWEADDYELQDGTVWGESDVLRTFEDAVRALAGNDLGDGG